MAALRLLIPLILTGIMVFSIVDIITIDSGRVKHLPKGLWLILVIILSFIGSILWFGIGRESLRSASYSSGPSSRPAPRVSGPDDDPEFLWRVQREREQEERIRKLEQRLSDLDDDKKE